MSSPPAPAGGRLICSVCGVCWCLCKPSKRAEACPGSCRLPRPKILTTARWDWAFSSPLGLLVGRLALLTQGAFMIRCARSGLRPGCGTCVCALEGWPMRVWLCTPVRQVLARLVSWWLTRCLAVWCWVSCAPSLALTSAAPRVRAQGDLVLLHVAGHVPRAGGCGVDLAVRRRMAPAPGAAQAGAPAAQEGQR